MKRPSALFRVSGHGHDATFAAKTVGAAVCRFRRLFSTEKKPLTLQTERDGWWKGISVEVKPLPVTA